MNWNQVVTEIGPRLYRYFSASFVPETASDLTQETLIRLVRKHGDGDFDPTQGSLLMFAYGIAKNIRYEKWKSARPEDHYADPKEYDHRVTEQQEVDQVEAHLAQLRNAISELNEIQSQVILLHIDQELTLQEIGGILGLPLNTVKSHAHRAKEILKKKLNPEGEVAHE